MLTTLDLEDPKPHHLHQLPLFELLRDHTLSLSTYLTTPDNLAYCINFNIKKQQKNH